MLIIIIDFGLALVYSYLSREKNVDILSQTDNTRLFVQNHFEIIDEKKTTSKGDCKRLSSSHRLISFCYSYVHKNFAWWFNWVESAELSHLMYVAIGRILLFAG